MLLGHLLQDILLKKIGMIVKVFNGSPYSAIQHAYPGRFIRPGNKLKKLYKK